MTDEDEKRGERHAKGLYRGVGESFLMTTDES